jgi:hypothetical protein
VQSWPVFQFSIPARLERVPGQKGAVRPVPEPKIPDPLALLGSGRELRWMCRHLADGNHVESDRMYRELDLVELWILYAEHKADQMVARVAQNEEVVRTA